MSNYPVSVWSDYRPDCNWVPFIATACFQVSLPESEIKAGLALQPQELEVSLVDRPLTDLLFTQFMASVSGKVHCLGKTLLIQPSVFQLQTHSFCEWTTIPAPDDITPSFMCSSKHATCPAASCDDLSVTLQPVSRQGERRSVTLPGSGDTLSFSFDNVLPGKYKGKNSCLAFSFPSKDYCCVLYYEIIPLNSCRCLIK